LGLAIRIGVSIFILRYPTAAARRFFEDTNWVRSVVIAGLRAVLPPATDPQIFSHMRFLECVPRLCLQATLGSFPFPPLIRPAQHPS